MIEPNTSIILLKNVPLDPTYNHTIRFADTTAQSTYFANKKKHRFDKGTYQRVNRGYMRIACSADECYDCNYLMFRNTNYGSKWFYAFITSVEYVSDACCEITYTLDVMQTWLFDYTIRDSMVVREHTATDEIGENILPEPVVLGEYLQNSFGKVNTINPLAVVVAVCDNGEQFGGDLFEGVFSGCVYYGFNPNLEADKEKLQILILKYLQSPDSIVGMWMCPLQFIGTRDSDGKIQHTEKGGSFTTEKGDIPKISNSATLNGYKPKNMKMYTYPYNYFQIDNGVDNSLILRYEMFDNLQPQLRFEGTKNAPVKCCVYPVGYKGSGAEPYRMESLNMLDYPMCSWNNDAYKVWLAQNTYINKVKMAQTVVNSTIGGVLNTTADLATGNAVGALADVTGSLTNVANEAINQHLNDYSASIQADLFKGTLGNSSLLISQNENSLFYRRMSIPYEYARTIDNFFTMYGYMVNRVKQPNVCSGKGLRPHWNYIQTSGAVARGSVPAQDIALICKIFDTGITFWENGEEVGNYTFDNSPS